jgi:16S rRNA processing protein RimM
LAVRREGAAEVLVPFVAQIVPEIDLAGRRIVIDPPVGLIDTAEDDEASS